MVSFGAFETLPGSSCLWNNKVNGSIALIEASTTLMSIITKHIRFLYLVSNRERVAQMECEQKQIEAYAYH